MKYGMVLDLSQCVRCESCTVACKLDNATEPSVKWGRVVEEEAGLFPNVQKAYVPLLCMHCENPQCVDACPTGASYQRADGIVLVDSSKCMGCRFCMVACPYQARYLNSTGTVEKCDLCIDRLQGGRQPVCVETCPYDARIFGDMDDPDSEISRKLSSSKSVVLKPDESYGPRVRYLVVK